MTISSGNFGGEQHATFVIGVRRKKSAIMAEIAEQRPKADKGNTAAAEQIASLLHDLRIHEYTLTANLVKNKRPGGTLVDEVDYEIFPTGRIEALNQGQLPRQYIEYAKQNGVVTIASVKEEYIQDEF